MSVMRFRKSGYTRPPSSLQIVAGGETIAGDADPLCLLIESMRCEKLRLADQLDQCSRTVGRLATLYAVIEQLHATINRSKICDAIADIVLNVIGGEQFALFEVHPRGACLTLIASAGIDPGPLSEVGFGEGLVGRVAASGRLFVKRDEDLNDGALWEETLSACIPLKIGRRLTGVIAIFGVQLQKHDFTPVDLEMFDLLTKHAALALHAAGSSATHTKRKKE